MTYLRQVCDEVLDYLPFKCRYCGGTFCKKHRLPENHSCTFSLERSSTVSNSKGSLYDEKSPPEIYNDDVESPNNYEHKLEREMRNYIRNQERSSMPPPPSNDSSRVRSFSRPSFGNAGKFKATYWLMGLNGGFFLLTFILGALGIDLSYFLLNFSTLFRNFRVWTLGTSMFSGSSIISLLFTMIILYGTGRMLEQQFGSRFLIYLYVGGGIFGAIAGLLMQLFLSILQIPTLSFNFANAIFSVQWAALIGMISFILFLAGLNREMRMYMYFIPIRMKGKYILYFLVGLDLLFVILGIFGVILPSTALESFAQIAALGAGYYFFKKYGRSFAISRFI